MKIRRINFYDVCVRDTPPDDGNYVLHKDHEAKMQQAMRIIKKLRKENSHLKPEFDPYDWL